jgi:protein-disulfide isomerase
MKSNPLIRTALTIVFVATAGAAFAADAFTDAKRKEIEQIIREYLLANPEVISQALDALQQRESERQQSAAKEGIKANAADLFRSPLDFVAGHPDGKVTVVEFFDYNCPYCKKSHPDVLALEKEQDVRLVMKEFPILGEGSTFAAKAAIAAKKQGKYWELHTAMMAAPGHIGEKEVLSIAEKVGLDTAKLPKDMDDPDNEAPIKLSHDLAAKLGINWTPTFIIGDQLIPGAIGLPGLETAIGNVRKNGCDVC